MWKVADRVVKARYVSPFQARMLIDALSDIHSCLAPVKLAPTLRSLIFDNSILVLEYDYIERQGIAKPEDLGFALGKAHASLTDIPVKYTLAWAGFYGEFYEFRFLVPLVEDTAIRKQAEQLLPHTLNRVHTLPVHYIHRDLNPDNSIPTENGVCLIDWEMTCGGHREDDVAMTICCFADSESASHEDKIAADFLEGYRQALPVPWADLSHPVLRSSIALAGLRQAVAGWFSDEGVTTAEYWINIRKRLRFACNLLKLG